MTGLDLTNIADTLSGAELILIGQNKDFVFTLNEPIVNDTIFIVWYDKGNARLELKTAIFNSLNNIPKMKFLKEWYDRTFGVIGNIRIKKDDYCRTIYNVEIEVTPHYEGKDYYWGDVSIIIPNLKIEDLL